MRSKSLKERPPYSYGRRKLLRAGKLTVLLCILAVQSLGVFNIFAAEQSKRKLNAYLKMLG